MIRLKIPDKKNAQSIVNAAKRDMDYTLTLEITQESAPTIARNIYECFRMLGDALCLLKGIETEDHSAPITQLQKLKIATSRPLGLLSNYKKTRHNINYYGYAPSLEEVKDMKNFAQQCFDKVKEKIESKINVS